MYFAHYDIYLLSRKVTLNLYEKPMNISVYKVDEKSTDFHKNKRINSFSKRLTQEAEIFMAAFLLLLTNRHIPIRFKISL